MKYMHIPVTTALVRTQKVPCVSLWSLYPETESPFLSPQMSPLLWTPSTRATTEALFHARLFGSASGADSSSPPLIYLSIFGVQTFECFPVWGYCA